MQKDNNDISHLKIISKLPALLPSGDWWAMRLCLLAVKAVTVLTIKRTRRTEKWSSSVLSPVLAIFSTGHKEHVSSVLCMICMWNMCSLPARSALAGSGACIGPQWVCWSLKSHSQLTIVGLASFFSSSFLDLLKKLLTWKSPSSQLLPLGWGSSLHSQSLHLELSQPVRNHSSSA